MKKVFIITTVAIGILLAVQIRSFKKIEFLIQRSEPATILAELRTLQIANAQLKEHLEESEKALAERRSKIASETIEEEINRLTLLSGEKAVAGEGIEITLSGSPKAFWISDLLAQLLSAGAEAVAFNDIRLTVRTMGFKSTGGGLLMRNHFLRPPLRITVIGPRKELKEAIGAVGSIIDRMKNDNPGLTVLLAERAKIIIPALGSSE